MSGLLLLSLFIFVNIGDAVTTWYGISTKLFHEGNPIVALFISNLGLVLGLVLAKTLALIFGAVLYCASFYKERKTALLGLVVMTGLMSLVFIKGLFLIMSAG